MERTMSVEDKIRRAEEIYNRRRENEYKVTSARVRIDNSRDNNKGINQRLKKMIIQIIVCMLMYLTFHFIINNNYIFSEDFTKKCEEILSYDISFGEMYKNISDVITSLQQEYQEVVNNSKQEEQQNVNNNEKEQLEEQNNTDNFQIVTNEQEQSEVSVDENIGGAVEEVASINETQELEINENTEIIQDEELTEEDQMKRDSEEIKSKISFIKPLEGTITSRFGWRNPTVSTVSKYHTGIDIAADEGTNIIAATSGKVVLASSKGAYGNHLKIEIEDIIILYAHCLSLEVEEGDEITQGQVIAKVGSTGNSTGPHLHFEIRKEDKYIDPDLILNF